MGVRKFLAAMALGAAAAAAALGLSGHAHADTGNGVFSGPSGDHDANALWVDVAPFDNTLTVATANTFGNTVCAGLRKGYSEGQLIAMGAHGNSSSISSWTYVVHAAEWHYCPEYY